MQKISLRNFLTVLMNYDPAKGVRWLEPDQREISLRCMLTYPQSNLLQNNIEAEITALSEGNAPVSFYLDTTEFEDGISKGEDHAQGLGRTHKLADGRIFWFLSYSETDHNNNRGLLMRFQYNSSTDGEHVTEEHAVAPMLSGPRNLNDPQPQDRVTIPINESHPSDLMFMRDVLFTDSGYLFQTQEYDAHVVAVYYWQPDQPLALIGSIPRPESMAGSGPTYVFMDRIGDKYYLGTQHVGSSLLTLYAADCSELFPTTAQGEMILSALKLISTIPFTFTNTPCQVKLVRDISGGWYLLAYCALPDDDPNGTDFVDIYTITWPDSANNGFGLTLLNQKMHIIFPSGDTGFANTGTHQVDNRTGKLLLSSSYRWAEDEGPGDSGFVTRVDEIMSH